MQYLKVFKNSLLAKFLKRRQLKIIIFVLMSVILLVYSLLMTATGKYKRDTHVVNIQSGIRSDNETTLRKVPDPSNLVDVLMENSEIKAELRNKKAVIAFLSLPIINDHNFAYIHNNAKACALKKTEVLLTVPSAPENFEKREIVRQGATGEFARSPENRATLLFFLGRPACGNESAVVQSKIDDEFNRYGDIVQENYEDVYKKIRLKAVGMLRWSVNFCKNAQVIIRIDDDIEVDISKIVPVVKLKSLEYFDFIIGSTKFGWPPLRNTSKTYFKYSISQAEYPNSTYPPFALGGLLGYPMTTVALLYQAALRVRPIWLDDVYITGICSRKVDVPLISHPDFTFRHGDDET